MYDNEADFIFESYGKIYEAPVGPGSSYDDELEGNLDASASDRLGKAQYGEITEADVHRVIAKIKEFLQGHENSIYPGSMDDMKLEIKVIIGDVLDSVNPTKAGYAARVIRNELKRLNVITDADGAVEVQNVHKVDTVEDELEDTLDVEDTDDAPAAGGFVLSAEYKVDRDELPNTASQQAKVAHEALLSAGMVFGIHSGMDIIKAADMRYADAKDVMTELEELGGIYKIEEEEDEDRIVDIGDESDNYDDVVSGEFDKLQRDMDSGASYTFRPDDF
jgi:hypothetical protein